MSTVMTHVLLAMALSAVGTSPQSVGREVKIIRVFVTQKQTEPTEFVEPDEQRELRDSVKDLSAALRDDPTVRLTAAAAESDIVLEVMGRSLRGTGGTTVFIVPNGFGGFNGASYPTAQTVVFVRMIVGGYTRDIVGAGRNRLWTAAAEDAVGQVRRWIDANREQIVAKRVRK